MCSDTNQYDRVCKGEFASIHTKLDRMDEAIRGNGKAGIQVRLDRLESVEAVRGKLLWIIAGATVTGAASLVWRLVLHVSGG
jgi:hypothetical protein